MFKDDLVSALTVKRNRGQKDELENRLAIEEKRLEMIRAGIQSQLAPQEAEIATRKAAGELQARRLEDLKVKAGMAGVLQCVCSTPTVQIEHGAQVAPGTNLARVANPTSLKAELRIAETQTKDIRIGQYAEVDTRNGVVKGKVSRIDPASSNGTVGVDVTLEGDLPPGARPDLSVDGNVRLEELNDIIYVGRPAFGQENSSVSLFKVRPGRPGGSHDRQARTQFGEHDRDRRGPAAGRSGDPVRHVDLGRLSAREIDAVGSRQLSVGS